jgi:hypothetical protein
MNAKSRTIVLLAALIMLLMFSGPAAATKAGDGCSFISPCKGAFSCQPGIQKCYNSPRREGQPCSAGFGCGAGLRCVAGSQRCVSANTGPTGILEQSAASAANAANAAAAAAAAARSRDAEQERTYARDPEPSQAQIEANQRADYEAQMRAQQQASQQAQYEAQARAQAEANQRAQYEAQARAQAEADERARQADVVRAQQAMYGSAYPRVSLRSLAYPDKFIRHGNYLGYVTSIIDAQGGWDASFRLLPGLAGRCTSFEAMNFPGYFLRHQNFRLKLAPKDNSQLFNDDATFCIIQGLGNPGDSSMESVNFPGYFITLDQDFALWVRQPDGSEQFRRNATFTQVPPFQSN